jgi:hypothetical protein
VLSGITTSDVVVAGLSGGLAEGRRVSSQPVGEGGAQGDHHEAATPPVGMH